MSTPIFTEEFQLAATKLAKVARRFLDETQSPDPLALSDPWGQEKTMTVASVYSNRPWPLRVSILDSHGEVILTYVVQEGT